MKEVKVLSCSSSRERSKALGQASAILILIFLSASMVATCRASTIWSDNFDDGNLDGWTVSGTSMFSGARTELAKGNFSVADKTLRATGVGKPMHYSILTHPNTVKVGTWSWDLYFNKEGTVSGYTGMAMLTDKPVMTPPFDFNGYGFDLTDTGTGCFYRYQKGITNIIGRMNTLTIQPTGWTRIDLARNENGQFSLYLDGTLCVEVTDSKYSNLDYFALWLAVGPVIDNVVISDVKVVSDVKIATKTCNVKISVKDPSGSVLQGVDVSSTTQPSGQTKLTGSTGADGTVTFTGVTPGDYTIQVSKSPYVTGTMQATMKIGTPNEFTSILQAQPTASTSGGVPGFPYLSVIIGILFCIGFFGLSRSSINIKD
jgi:hypothetical protein